MCYKTSRSLASKRIIIENSQFCIARSYRRYISDDDGLHADAKKVKAIVDYPVTKNVKELQMFRGICGFYMRFIENFGTNQCAALTP